jgi:hypothetical protein
MKYILSFAEFVGESFRCKSCKNMVDSNMISKVDSGKCISCCRSESLNKILG